MDEKIKQRTCNANSRMTDAEEPPVAAAPVDHGPGADSYGPLPDYDEALLERGKNGRPKKPVKPDDTDRNITLDKLSAEAKRLGDRIAEIKALEQSRRTKGVDPEVAEHRHRKGELGREWQTVLVRVLRDT